VRDQHASPRLGTAFAATLLVGACAPAQLQATTVRDGSAAHPAGIRQPTAADGAGTASHDGGAFAVALRRTNVASFFVDGGLDGRCSYAAPIRAGEGVAEYLNRVDEAAGPPSALPLTPRPVIDVDCFETYRPDENAAEADPRTAYVAFAVELVRLHAGGGRTDAALLGRAFRMLRLEQAYEMRLPDPYYLLTKLAFGAGDLPCAAMFSINAYVFGISSANELYSEALYQMGPVRSCSLGQITLAG